MNEIQKIVNVLSTWILTGKELKIRGFSEHV